MNERMPDLNEAELQKGQGFEFVVPSSEIGARSTAENNHRLEVKSSYEAMSNNLRANLLVAVAELNRGIRQQLRESMLVMQEPTWNGHWHRLLQIYWLK